MLCSKNFLSLKIDFFRLDFTNKMKKNILHSVEEKARMKKETGKNTRIKIHFIHVCLIQLIGYFLLASHLSIFLYSSDIIATVAIESAIQTFPVDYVKYTDYDWSRRKLLRKSFAISLLILFFYACTKMLKSFNVNMTEINWKWLKNILKT